MSAEYSTENLQLCYWVPSDRPEMDDFNRDNQILDRVVGEHIENSSMHISQSDRSAWDMPYSIVGYAGDGQRTREIPLNVGFEPNMVIVIGTNITPGIVDIQNEAHYNYFGIATTQGSSIGLGVDGNVLTISNHPTPISSTEMRSYNQLGKTYIAICFR